MAKINMKDVANHAGVSVATVSHVINNTRKVSEKTRKKVQKSILELDFHPDPLARSLKMGRSNLIAFLVPDIANAFFATLIEEIEDVLSQEGYQMIVANTREDKKQEIEILKSISNGMVDGIIIASTFESYSEIAEEITSLPPTIFVDRKPKNCPHDIVTVESGDSVYEGIDYLIQKGHRKIGYITADNEISTTTERLAAYKRAMIDNDLYDDSLVLMGHSMSRCVNSKLSGLLERDCTALVAANNVLATDAMMQLLEQGIRPGVDIELLSFIDSDQAQYGLQHMNQIKQPTVALGRTTGKQMLERLHDPDFPVRQIILQSQFIPKE